MSRYYLNGKIIQLEKLIGEGGEGKVYLSSSAPGKVVKIYTDSSDTLRSSKIQKMVSLGLAKKSNLISFPDQIVTSENGKILGFSMNFVKDHQQVHNLYGVKSRKIFFPEADYRFLVRVASNIARAIAQVHTYPCVIGDINHSGVLVSQNATVALIDADSFQLKDNGILYPCVVGVPDFTPPELQGKSLRNLERTTTHDQFGLAVLIFQILIMGRHPFAGRGRELTLEESIAQFLYAYTNGHSNGITPPPGVPSLSDFPQPIANAFEYSFSVNGPNKRTTALEWIALLQELENNLQKCSINTKHFYPNSSRNCPWCRMENQTGVILFMGGVTLLSSSISIEEIERFVAEIKSFNVDESNLFPKFPTVNFLKPSSDALLSKRNKVIKNIGSKILWVCAVICFFAIFTFNNAIFFFFAVFLGWHANKTTYNEPEKWINRYKDLDNQWATKLQSWREKTLGGIFQNKFNIEKAVYELKELVIEKERKISNIKSSHREKQLDDYLDKILIKNAKIEHIHKSLVASLASYGIESAADIEYYKIRNIPQFGDKRTNNLIAWKKSHERNFKYNPTLQSNDVNEQNKIINEFELKLREKKGYIEKQKRAFDLARSDYTRASQSEDSDLSQIFIEREQLRVDLNSLGISVPYPSSINSFVHKPIFNLGSSQSKSTWGNPKSQPVQAPQPVSQSITPYCPKCSGQMVKRWGRRGGFWGCSKYPRCNGTRNF